MSNADDPILEFLEENPIALPPAVVTFHVDYSDTYIRERMRDLESKGLLEKAHETKGYYKIADRGKDYLHGNLESSDLKYNK